MMNKVLAIILYMSGLFDSKSIVKEVVWRKTTNKGGAFINPRWGLIFPGISKSRFINGPGAWDFINGGGLLIQVGD